MPIPRVPLNIDDRGYAGSLLLPRAPGAGGAAGGAFSGLLEEAARLRNAISAAQIRAINEEVARSQEERGRARDRFGREKSFQERELQKLMEGTPGGRRELPYDQAAESILGGTRSYREPGDTRRLSNMLRFLGPELAQAGMMQSGNLLSSGGATGKLRRPETPNTYSQLSGSASPGTVEPTFGDLNTVVDRMRASPRLPQVMLRGADYSPRRSLGSFTNADLGHEKGTLPGTIPRTGPAKLHRGEVVLSADQVDEPLLYYLLQDKIRKLRSGQMDGEGTGPGKKHHPEGLEFRRKRMAAFEEAKAGEPGFGKDWPVGAFVGRNPSDFSNRTLIERLKELGVFGEGRWEVNQETADRLNRLLSYRKGSLPSYQRGMDPDMLKGLDPEELADLDRYMTEAERELSREMAIGGRGRKRMVSGKAKPPATEPPPIRRSEIRRSDALRRELLEEPLEGFAEFDPTKPHELIPTGERYAQDALATRPPLAARTGLGSSAEGFSGRPLRSGKGGLLTEGTGGGALVRLEKMAASPEGRETLERVAENPRVPRKLRVAVGAILAGAGVASLFFGGGKEEEAVSAASDILPPPSKAEVPGAVSELPTEEEMSRGWHMGPETPPEPLEWISPTPKAELPKSERVERNQRILGDVLKSFFGGEFGAGGPEKTNLEQTPEDLSKTAEELRGRSAEGPSPSSDLDAILEAVTSEREQAREEEKRSGPSSVSQHKAFLLRTDANRLWDDLQKRVDSLSDEEFKLIEAKARRLDSLADRIESREEKKQSRVEELRDFAEEALQRTREARMQRGTEIEETRAKERTAQSEALRKEKREMDETIRRLQGDLPRAAKEGEEEWQMLIGLLAEAFQERERLEGDEPRNPETGEVMELPEIRERLEAYYTQLLEGGV